MLIFLVKKIKKQKMHWAEEDRDSRVPSPSLPPCYTGREASAYDDKLWSLSVPKPALTEVSAYTDTGPASLPNHTQKKGVTIPTQVREDREGETRAHI